MYKSYAKFAIFYKVAVSNYPNLDNTIRDIYDIKNVFDFFLHETQSISQASKQSFAHFSIQLMCRPIIHPTAVQTLKYLPLWLHTNICIHSHT